MSRKDVIKRPAKSFVNCYYCGKRVPRHKAIPLYVNPRLVPEVKESEKPLIVQTGPEKIYVCLSCARFRGLSFKDWKRRLLAEKEEEKILRRILELK